MKSNFTVKCPYCEKENNFTGDNWHDELIDDSSSHIIPCMYCGKDMEIQVDATYTLSVEKPEYDEDGI
jgi:endogenous inhibitor of DNA gyrase (YacG/DUF329 family)